MGLTESDQLALDSHISVASTRAFGPAQTASTDDVEVQTSPGAPGLPALGLAVEAVELALWCRLSCGYVGFYVKLPRLGDRSFEPLPVGQHVLMCVVLAADPAFVATGPRLLPLTGASSRATPRRRFWFGAVAHLHAWPFLGRRRRSIRKP